MVIFPCILISLGGPGDHVAPLHVGPVRPAPASQPHAAPPGVLPSSAASAQAWLRSWPLNRWNWNSCVLMTPPVEQEPSGEALWMRVELARPEGGVRRVCGSGTQLRDHCLSARSCHTCLRTALLRLGLQSPHLLTGARASPLLPAVVQDHVEPASASE